MAIPIYPNLQGETWPIVKRIIFSTIISKASSGLEVRVGNYSTPLFEWDLTYSWLSQEAAIQDFQALVNCYVAAFGQLGQVQFSDPSDNNTNGLVQIGTGDGVTKDFSLSGRSPLVVTSTSPVAGSVDVHGVHYASAPPVGTPILINFTYFYLVRFATDDAEFYQFVQDWWEAKKITLRQVRV